MPYKIIKKIFFSLFILATFTACQDNTIDEGMKTVHWDRDVCERCKMIVSERKFTVQIFNPNNKQTYVFDDLGCAVTWFNETNQNWFKDAKIWINDAVSGQWLNAKEAIYIADTLTPMGYGLSAYSKKTIIENSQHLNFDQAVHKILEIDQAQKERRKQH